MQKETDRCVRQLFAEHSGEEQQLIVVYPNQIVWSIAADNRLTKSPVRFHVSGPMMGIKLQLRREIVKDGPESLIGVTFIESCRHFLRELHREAVIFFRPLRKNCPPLFGA